MYFSENGRMDDTSLLLEETKCERNNETAHKRRKTNPCMTKYEHARVLGTRALQISMGAPIMVPLEPHETDFLGIARKELAAGCLPAIVKRYLPNGTYEEWDVNELSVDSI